uniref:Uncharacterized protein n=1 Tax=Rhizophora mucronata TaxID=61149 RepID=A0A2P2R3L1_RHIMU
MMAIALSFYPCITISVGKVEF